MKTNERHYRLKVVPLPPAKSEFAYALLGAAMIAGLVTLLVLGVGAINAHFRSHPVPVIVTSKVVSTEPLGVLIDRISTEVGIHPVLAHALVQAESSKNRNAISRTGAVGLTQVLRSTAKGECGIENVSELAEPEPNLRCGFTYLKKLKAVHKTWWRALIAYNIGGANVNHPTKESLKYANNILVYCKNVIKEI